MLVLEQSTEGVVISVRVHASARRNAVIGAHDGTLRIDVTTAPEKGKANAAVVRVLAAALGIPKSALELTSGATSPHKKILATGLTAAEVCDRLEALLQSGGSRQH